MNRCVPIVLLIEHDPVQRATLARVLKAAGYSVIPVRHAYDALETFVTHHTDITLVVADTQSARSAGPPLLCALHMIDPRVPVVAVSPNASMERRADHYPNVAATLTQPFAPADLLAHVDHVLETHPSDRRHPSTPVPSTVGGPEPMVVVGAAPFGGGRTAGRVDASSAGRPPRKSWTTSWSWIHQIGVWRGWTRISALLRVENR